MKKIIYLIVCVLSTIKLSSQNFEKYASTPPMGWNSWDCYGPTVTENEVKANADYMAKFLKNDGWEYIVIDIRWYIENDKAHGYNEKDAIFVMDEYGRLLPSPAKFPSAANGKGFKSIADYIHGKGLKLGIHIMRGIPKEAVKKNTPVLGTQVKASEIYNTDRLCKWLGDMYTVDYQKKGSQEYYNSIFDLYASWGVDFVKVDDLSYPYHQEEIEMIRKAIDRTGRKIVLSTSPGETPIENAGHVKTHANMWRTVGDFWDSWTQLKEHFEVCNRWSPHIGNGHFPDADMLPLGRIGIRAENGDDRMTRFTKDEQYTLMTLFSIFRSPLMFGGDLPSNDNFTLSLLNNKDVLYIDKYSKNNRQLFRQGDFVAWTADDSKGKDKFLALFYIADQDKIVEEKSIWKSEMISANKKSHSADIDIPLSNSRKLYLVVSEGDNGTGWDHADWIEPKIYSKTDTMNLSELKWTKAYAGWGKATLNKSVGGNTLNVDGYDYQNGIGTHSTSMIEYEIPDGYTRFTAKVGLDKECLEHPEGASVKFLVFDQDPSGPMPSDSIKISVNLEQIGIKGKCVIKDLWNKKVMNNNGKDFSPYINFHGAGLYRISEVK